MGACDKLLRGKVNECLRVIGFSEVNQILNIALRSLDRREVEMEHVKAVLQDKLIDTAHHLSVHLRVADNALFADLFPSCLKLRLDQADRLSVFRHQLTRDRENQTQRNKTDVDGEKVDRVGHLFACDLAHIGALKVDDAFVGAQLPRELTVADVDRVDFFRAVLEHAVRKAARGRADVHCGFAAEIKPESRLMEDLKADSANIMVMIMDMEDRFGITVEDDQIMKLKTVGDVAEYIAKVKG